VDKKGGLEIRYGIVKKLGGGVEHYAITCSYCEIIIWRGSTSLNGERGGKKRKIKKGDSKAGAGIRVNICKQDSVF